MVDDPGDLHRRAGSPAALGCIVLPRLPAELARPAPGATSTDGAGRQGADRRRAAAVDDVESAARLVRDRVDGREAERVVPGHRGEEAHRGDLADPGGGGDRLGDRRRLRGGAVDHHVADEDLVDPAVARGQRPGAQRAQRGRGGDADHQAGEGERGAAAAAGERGGGHRGVPREGADGGADRAQAAARRRAGAQSAPPTRSAAQPPTTPDRAVALAASSPPAASREAGEGERPGGACSRSGSAAERRAAQRRRPGRGHRREQRAEERGGEAGDRPRAASRQGSRASGGAGRSEAPRWTTASPPRTAPATSPSRAPATARIAASARRRRRTWRGPAPAARSRPISRRRSLTARAVVFALTPAQMRPARATTRRRSGRIWSSGDAAPARGSTARTVPPAAPRPRWRPHRARARGEPDGGERGAQAEREGPLRRRLADEHGGAGEGRPSGARGDDPGDVEDGSPLWVRRRHGLAGAHRVGRAGRLQGGGDAGVEGDLVQGGWRPAAGRTGG